MVFATMQVKLEGNFRFPLDLPVSQSVFPSDMFSEFFSVVL